MKANFFVIAICCFAFFEVSQAQTAKPEAKYDLATLCTSGIEGTFIGNIGKSPTLFNVICLDDSRMAMGINFSLKPTEVMPLTLINSIIDDDQTLVFSMSPLDQADRKSATSGSPTSYVRLDIEALKKGELSGVYVGGTTIHPMLLNAKRRTAVPPISSFKSNVSDLKALTGIYQFQLTPSIKISFWFDTVNQVPVIDVDDGNKGDHLIDGPAWDGKGGFAVVNVFGDYMPVEVDNLVQMRGFSQKPGQLEVYYIDLLRGVQGPFTAIKQPTSSLYGTVK